jgi:hypothetical protein
MSPHLLLVVVLLPSMLLRATGRRVKRADMDMFAGETNPLVSWTPPSDLRGPDNQLGDEYPQRQNHDTGSGCHGLELPQVQSTGTEYTLF